MRRASGAVGDTLFFGDESAAAASIQLLFVPPTPLPLPLLWGA